MRTKISKDNPFGYSRYGFAWEHVPQVGGAHLDFGCGGCLFLNAVKSKDIERVVGVDVSAEAVERAKANFADLEVVKIDGVADLPFEDEQFDSITVLDVIEHVHEQQELLDSLRRILKPGGRLIVTVPGRHLFSFCDMGNLKFRFPRVHRWFYLLRHSREEYDLRYKSNADGLIGDVSAKKAWHEHFGRGKMGRLLDEAGFDVEQFDGAGFFNRIIHNAWLLCRRVKPVAKVLMKLEKFDAKVFGSTHLFCLAVKRSQHRAKL